MGVKNRFNQELDTTKIQTLIGHMFGDISEYIQRAKIQESIIKGWIIYDPNSSFIKNHTVAQDGRLLVPGTILVESAFRLLALYLVYSEKKGEPRARGIESFKFLKEVEAGKDEVDIKITEIRRRESLVLAKVECTINSKVVAKGEIKGVILEF